MLTGHTDDARRVVVAVWNASLREVRVGREYDETDPAAIAEQGGARHSAVEGDAEPVRRRVDGPLAEDIRVVRRSVVAAPENDSTRVRGDYRTRPIRYGARHCHR